MRSIVIGAGFAGLSAGVALADAGVDVVVLEARDRVGGRVWSQELVPGDPRTVIERGAEFVLEGYDHLHAWITRLDLGLANTTMSYYVREPRGGEPVTVAGVAAAASVLADAARAAPSSTSVASIADEVLASRSPGGAGIDPAAVAAILTRISISWASEVSDLSCRALQGPASAFVPNPTYRVAGGNQGIARAMATRLGARVRLGCPVRGIAHDDESVSVMTDGGVELADVVVVTIPLALTSALPVDPPLPAWKHEAWARTGRGQAAKLHVQLAEQAPASAVMSVPDGYWTWAATDASGLVQPVAHCFAGSAPALERLEVERDSSTWLGRLRALRPELCLDEERALLTTWADDPWARMAYSAERWSSDGDDPRLMAEPVGRIHFAGEHTAGDWAGLMEGALRSGDRVAQEVLRARDRPGVRGR